MVVISCVCFSTKGKKKEKDEVWVLRNICVFFPYISLYNQCPHLLMQTEMLVDGVHFHLLLGGNSLFLLLLHAC